jgi:hypothetical protein
VILLLAFAHAWVPSPTNGGHVTAPDSRVWRAARKQDERARWSAVVPLALEKRLFLNVRRECLLVPPFGKKPCNINKRLETF